MTATELAIQANISAKTLSKIESGQSEVKIGTLVAIATALKVSLDYLQQKKLDQYSGKGVKVTTVREDTETQMNIVYDPSHPDADEDGYVTYPNVNIVTEMTNLIDAANAYQANATAFNASKQIAQMGLTMGK